MSGFISHTIVFLIGGMIGVFMMAFVLYHRISKATQQSKKPEITDVPDLSFKNFELKPHHSIAQYVYHSDCINSKEMDRIEQKLIDDMGKSFTENIVDNNLINKNIYQIADGVSVRYSCTYWLPEKSIQEIHND